MRGVRECACPCFPFLTPHPALVTCSVLQAMDSWTTASCFPSPHSHVFLHGCKIKFGSGLSYGSVSENKAGYNHQAGQG